MVIDVERCLALVATQQVGRYVTGGTKVRLRPVDYVTEGGSIFFRTERPPGSGSDIVFEVDHFNSAEREGWSVIIEGRASSAGVDDLCPQASERLDPWAPGQNASLTKIDIDVISGRWVRAEREPIVTDDRGYL